MFATFFEKYPEKHVVRSASVEEVARHSGHVPDAVLEFWTEYGFGSYLNDYLKVVAPEDFDDILACVYIRRTGHPKTLFATGMADLLVWEDGYLVQVNCRAGVSRIIESGFRYFFEDLCDPDFLDANLGWGPYPEARKRLGPLAYDECYGYVPILAAGGSDDPSNLERVKLCEHLQLVGSIAGPV